MTLPSGPEREPTVYERRTIVSKCDTQPGSVDPDDAPELTDEWFDAADLKVNGKVVRRGRPPGSNKQQVAIRLDRDVIDHFKAQGPGWQKRINEALRHAAKLDRKGAA